MLFQFLMTAPDCASARPGTARPPASVRVTAVPLTIVAMTPVLLIRDMTSLLVIRSTPAGVPFLRPSSSGLILPPLTVHKTSAADAPDTGPQRRGLERVG